MRITIITILLLTSFSSMFSQKIEEEVGFKYVKAEYLMTTERLEDAIKELNDIIKVSPVYKDALMLRANTRYRLGAFKGAKDDILKSIEAIGITLGAASLLGKTEYALGNVDPALNSLTAAISLGSQDERIYELRADIYEDKGELLKACEDWYTAEDLGSTKGAINARKFCGKRTNSSEPTKTPPVDVGTSSTSDNSDDSTEEESTSPTNADNSSTQSNDNSEEVVDDEINSVPIDDEDNSTIPVEDNTPNKIEIDEDLSLSIYGQGIGKRKILDRPSILILSDQTGTVVVEVCINENGKIDYAEFNPAKSTLTKNSLVSLAIRKSKEFWFEKSDYKKQCGFIVFNIKGSE